MMVSSAMETCFAKNLTVQAMYRAEDRSWLPGPADSVSIALVDGISPPEFKAYVRSVLTYVDGWKKNPTVVFNTMFDAAESGNSLRHTAGAILQQVQVVRAVNSNRNRNSNRLHERRPLARVTTAATKDN
ncbi:unnamed protein product [Sphacelaria rigidula]